MENNDFIPLKTFSWEHFKNSSKKMLPYDFNSTQLVNTPEKFDIWKKRFISKFGDNGTIHFDGLWWEIKDNPKWDSYVENGFKTMFDFNKNLKYKGD